MLTNKTPEQVLLLMCKTTAQAPMTDGEIASMPAGEPLRTQCAQVKGGHFSLVSAFLSKFNTGAIGYRADEPTHTITAGGKQKRPGTAITQALVTAHIQRDFGTSIGHAADDPLATVTSTFGGHAALVQSFLLSYYGSETYTDSVNNPMRTVTSRDRFGLVTIKGVDYQIVDIGLRMLTPRELFRAQGFPENYIIGDKPEQGLSLTKTEQVRMVGNSVCPPSSSSFGSCECSGNGS